MSGQIDNKNSNAWIAIDHGLAADLTLAPYTLRQNLTSYAMERNMEAGVLISGGHIPSLLNQHLRSLVETKIVCAV